MSEISEYLRALRGKKSLRAVQKDTQISHTYLNSLEKGIDRRSNKEIKPSQEVLKQLADYYKVSYADLLKKAGYVSDESEAKEVKETKTKRFFPVREDYEFTEKDSILDTQKILIEKGETRLIDLELNENLLEEFCLINADDEKEILAFIKKYGKLGRESLPKKLKLKDHNHTYVEVFEAETLDWIQIHIKTVKLVLDLLPCIKIGDTDSIIKLIEDAEVEVGLEGGQLRKASQLGKLGEYTVISFSWLKIEPMRFGIDLVKMVLNDNIRSVRREFVIETGKLESRFTSDTLLEIIYWQLANKVHDEHISGYPLLRT